MRRLLAIFSFLTGAFIMLYVSNWLMFICAIIDAVHMSRGEMDATALSISLLALRILASPFVWGIGGVIFMWGGLFYLPYIKSKSGAVPAKTEQPETDEINNEDI